MGRRKIIYFVVFGFFLIFFLILFHLESHRLNTIQCNCGSPSATSIFSNIFCGKKKIFFFFWSPWLTDLWALCIMGHTRISSFNKKTKELVIPEKDGQCWLVQKPELKSVSQACDVTTDRKLMLCKLVKTPFLLLQSDVSIDILQSSEFELNQKHLDCSLFSFPHNSFNSVFVALY